MTVIEDSALVSTQPRLDAAPETAAAGDSKPQNGNRKRLFLLIGIAIAAILLVGGGLWWLQARQFVFTDDAFIDGDIAHVSAQISGRVARLLVDDNEPVVAGQLLAEIDPTDIQAAPDQARAGEREAEAELAQAQTQIAVGQANLAQAAAQTEASAAAAVSRKFQC